MVTHRTRAALRPRLALFGGATALALSFAAGAHANPAVDSASYFDTGFGGVVNDFNTPFEPGTRDAFGNRLVINGRIIPGDQMANLPPTLTGNFQPSFGGVGRGQGTAIGNLLNVVIDGNNNTVVVTSSQTNEGDVTATFGAENTEEQN